MPNTKNRKGAILILAAVAVAMLFITLPFVVEICILCNHPALCNGNPAKDPCTNADATVGVVVKVPLFDLVGAKSNGKYPVPKRMISGVSLDTVSNKGSEITGHFVRVVNEGAIGTKLGSPVRIALVQ